VGTSFLALGGYTLQNWQTHKQDILNAVEGAEISEIATTDWGTRFKVESQWNAINGQLIRVITIWQQDEGSDRIQFAHKL